MLRLKKIRGFTVVESITFIVVICALAIILVPVISKIKNYTCQYICINNLRLIDAAKEQFMIEQHKGMGYDCSPADIDPYFEEGIGNIWCPSNPEKCFYTSYEIHSIGGDPECLQEGFCVSGRHVL